MIRIAPATVYNFHFPICLRYGERLTCVQAGVSLMIQKYTPTAPSRTMMTEILSSIPILLHTIAAGEGVLFLQYHLPK